MAILFIDGLDTYNGSGANTGCQSKWIVAGAAIGLAAGRFGGQAFSVNHGVGQGQQQVDRLLSTNPTSVCVGYAFRQSIIPAADLTHHHLTLLDSSGGFQIGVRTTAAGGLQVVRATGGNAGTILGTTVGGIIGPNTFHYVELGITISDTVGVVNLNVGGISRLALTNQDTRNGTTDIGRIRFGHATLPNVGTLHAYDDIYVTDTATPLGERRVETLYPTSDIAQGFARSTGATNYTLVDETLVNGDTDYVQGSAVSDRDTYGFGNLSSTPAAIDAVQVVGYAQKTDAASRSLALQVISGATTSDGSNYSLAVGYQRLERLLLLNPDGSVAWTPTTVNALTGGPKVTV